MKDVSGSEISHKLKNGRVKVVTFSGAIVQCMADYAKPSLHNKSNHLILHTGTNDLNSSKTTEFIATSIVDQAIRIKDNHHDLSVSNKRVKVIRKDHLKKNAEEVNSYLKAMY